MKKNNKINKYKIVVIVFLILSSGCTTTDYLKFKTECETLPDNYLNESLNSEYEKEKSFYAVEYRQDVCAYSTRCTLLEKGEKWDFIEIYLKSNGTLFPYNSGYYRIYRNFSFKNCINNYRGFVENKFTNKNGSFCISANKIKSPVSRLVYKHTESKSKESRYISFINIEVFLGEKKYLSINDLRFSPPNTSNTCKKTNTSKNNILSDFN